MLVWSDLHRSGTFDRTGGRRRGVGPPGMPMPIISPLLAAAAEKGAA